MNRNRRVYSQSLERGAMQTCIMCHLVEPLRAEILEAHKLGLTCTNVSRISVAKSLLDLSGPCLPCLERRGDVNITSSYADEYRK